MMLDETSGPNIGPYFCAGLATRNSVTGEVTDIFGEEIHCFPKHKREAVGVAIDNQDGKLVLVLMNPNENSKM